MALSLGFPSVVNVGGIKLKSCRASVQWGCDDADSNALLSSGICLQNWLTQTGLPLQKVELKNVGAGGRGLVCTKMLYKGDRLLFLPSSLTITTNSKWTCSEAGNLLRGKVPDWPLLACYLISEAASGKNSPWYNYIAALPRRPGSILQWTVSDVEKHLASTSIKHKAVECIEEVENTFKDMNSRFFSKNTTVFPLEDYNIRSFKWAFGILFSRLVRLPSLGEQLALVPFGDMLNHSTEVTSFLDFDSSTNSIICAIDRGYEAGNEVFISYGRRSNAELLMAYGFIPSGLNPADSVNISIALDPKDEMYNAKLAALERHGISSPQVYPIKLNGWPVQLTAFARLLTSGPSQLQQYTELAAAATEKQENKMPFLKPEEETKVYEVILSACEESIKACSNYLESKDNSRGSSLSKLARTLCESELKILYRNQYILRSELRNLRSGKGKGKSSRGMLDRVGSLFKGFR